MNQSVYVLSFVGGALLHNASVVVAQQYDELKDWNKVREAVLSANLLQARTESTLKRIYTEVAERIKLLSDVEIAWLINSSHNEQAYFLWLAVCRRYRFIADFAVEVLHDHFVTFKPQLTYDDYLMFYLRKTDIHFELEQITENTQRKMRQVLFLMMAEAGLLDEQKNIIPALLTPKFIQVLSESNFKEALYFPVFEGDLIGSL